ncbi:DUF2254 domain-containing protein [Mesorhizobium sp. NBSH29]|uniref:DUF2254 domain-containing protein n=1 Tax=Mesorhizobium sp. NBSH29 TaxID=2654249 RepID=UPI0018965445|nr:DUF2254 domain-containing protein [Mesorhizobium sp. NBSH29]QPC85329.1 DUF2254 domain-containing protein [Mesorhizobium sp. NBSH29]
MISKWQWLLSLVTRRLWFRATLISLLAVGAALLSLLISPYLPFGLSAKIGADAVDRILDIIATSMLAVTTFSLSTMVAAYSAATSNVTPRATKLLIEDSTTQNVLATFVGSFLYSLVAIITLSMGAYGERGRVVLFVVTVLVIFLIVATLLRWIDYLQRLGRVGETTDVVEDATVRAMRARRKKPYLGGQLLADPVIGIPEGCHPVFAQRIGYVQHIDTAAIAHAARSNGGRVYLSVLPGTFVDLKRPLAWCSSLDPAEDLTDIRDAFTIATERTFDQDPRFGMSVLAEIASRALSPAINDPGTAIDVIGRAVRVLSVWSEETEESKAQYPNIWVPQITPAELFNDIFVPIARDGQHMVEVQVRLQKAFAALARSADPTYVGEAMRHSADALARAEAAMAFGPDIARVRDASSLVGVTV